MVYDNRNRIGKVEKGNSSSGSKYVYVTKNAHSEAGPSTVNSVKVPNIVPTNSKTERLDFCSEESVKKANQEMAKMIRNKNVLAPNAQHRLNQLNAEKQKAKTEQTKTKKEKKEKLKKEQVWRPKSPNSSVGSSSTIDKSKLVEVEFVI